MSNLNAKVIEKVSIQLDWLHQFQFAGYYIAKEKGYFKEVNLDVSIKEFDFGINLLDDVLNSKSEYAIGKSSLIIDKLDNKDIVLLAAIYQNSPMVLISLKKSNISTPFKLKGKRVMLTPDARSAASINSMIIAQGIELKDIKFQTHSFKLDDLIQGKTDAMGCYLSNEPFILKKKGIAFDVHNPSEYGFNFYGGLLFTSNKELKEHPLRVKRMYEAVLKGWNYAFTHIEETAKIIYDKYNTQNKSLESLIYEGNILKKLAMFEEGKLGKLDYERIEELKRLYLLLGLSQKSIDFKLNDFIYSPNKINLTSEEKNYLNKNTIKLLSNSNFPPFTINNDHKLSGIEIDFWDLINKKLNFNGKIEIEESNENAIKKILITPSKVKYVYGKTLIKNDSFKTTNNIESIKYAIATLIDKPFIDKLTELSNVKVAIGKYSIINQKLRNKYPNIDFIEVLDLKEGLDLLTEKKVYAVISKLPSLAYAIRHNINTNIKISGILEEKFNIQLAVNSNNPILLNILNKAISSISNKEKEQINNKYFAIIYETKANYSWVYKVFIILILIILIILFTNLKLKKEIRKRKLIEAKLFRVANIDSLTKIYNRRKIESLFNTELLRVKRYKRNLSIIFFDIDNFKLINDDLGHSIGDNVLVKIAQIVKSSIRKTDYFGRWGGEEFILILPETSKEQATNIAHALKDKINTMDFNINRNVTCSFGVSQYEETDSADSLLTRADNAMYFIKKNGKNSVKVV